MFRLYNSKNASMTRTNNIRDIYDILLNCDLEEREARRFMIIAGEMKQGDLFLSKGVLMICK